MIVIAGTLRMPPERVEEMRPHIVTVTHASRAEPGALAYSLAFDPIEPGLIRVFEIYRDWAAVEAHRDSAHFKAWRAVSGEFVRDLKLYDAQERPPA